MSICPARFFDDAIAAVGHTRTPEPARRRHDLPAAHRSGRAGTLPHHRRERDHRGRLQDLWLAPGAGRRLGDRRAAQRTRPEIEQILIAGPMPERAGPPPSSSATSISCAAASRRRSSTRRSTISTSARSSASRSSTRASSSPRACRSSIRTSTDERFDQPRGDLPPALFDQHLPAMVAGPAVPLPRAQWRDQHDPRQQELDDQPRDQDGERSRSASSRATSSR